MIVGALIGAAAVFAYCWADGVHRCPDGDRYTSGKPQPRPFNRRFCGWSPKFLMLATWISLAAIAGMLGSWKGALLFAGLPGVWWCATHPTSNDGPAMALALMSSLLVHAGHPMLAIGSTVLSGLIHERGPVFSALYAWSPIPLAGLIAPLVFLLASRPVQPDHPLMGHGLFGAMKAHRGWGQIDLLGDGGLVWSLRGLPVMAAYLGADWRAWPALGVACASRLIGTDTARFLMWAAPALLLRMPEPPLWMVVLQVMTFRRAVF